MTKIRLPALIDAHVHLRDPGYTVKEDFYSGTSAAVAGGLCLVLDMPNTQPPTATPSLIRDKAALAASKAVCDVGLFAGATTSELDAYLPAATRVCGLKIYVSETFGSLRIEALDLLHRFFRTWAEAGEQHGYRMAGRADGIGPIAVHAEELMLPVCLMLSHLYNTPLHIVHVSRRSEIELIAAAKERGYPVTCEVTPHHLFLTEDDAARLGALGDMRPRLASADDVAAMWEHLAYVDLFATDHAPHTLEEKGRADGAPPGVPGVETMLPLLLTAVHDDRLTLEDVTGRLVDGPRRVYGLPELPDSYVEVEVDEPFRFEHKAMHTRVKWTPFDGQEVYGRVCRTVLRGEMVFQDGEVIASPGSGRVLFGAAKEM